MVSDDQPMSATSVQENWPLEAVLGAGGGSPPHGREPSERPALRRARPTGSPVSHEPHPIDRGRFFNPRPSQRSGLSSTSGASNGFGGLFVAVAASGLL